MVNIFDSERITRVNNFLNINVRNFNDLTDMSCTTAPGGLLGPNLKKQYYNLSGGKPEQNNKLSERIKKLKIQNQKIKHKQFSMLDKKDERVTVRSFKRYVHK